MHTRHCAILERVARSIAIVLLISVRVLAAQAPLSRVQKLYEAADYDSALTVLDEAGEFAGPRHGALEYRALCLLALDRTDDMERTIEQLIQFDPLYHPSTERPPRFLTAFDSVHRRLLPSIVRQRYLDAKASLGENRYAESSAGFELVLRLLDERDDDSEDVQGLDDQLRADFEALAKLRLDATRAAQAPRPVPPVPAIYRSGDPGVIPPVPIRQAIPSWQSAELGPAAFSGEIELLIDTRGDVQEARLVVPIHPTYDPIILEAAATWKYHPATKDGRPVVYRKSITISLMPQKGRATNVTRS